MSENNVSMNVSESQEQEVPMKSVPLRLLNDMKLVLDMASQRGTFKGPELSTVGNLYDRLSELTKN